MLLFDLYSIGNDNAALLSSLFGMTAWFFAKSWACLIRLLHLLRGHDALGRQEGHCSFCLPMSTEKFAEPLFSWADRPLQRPYRTPPQAQVATLCLHKPSGILQPSHFTKTWRWLEPWQISQKEHRPKNFKWCMLMPCNQLTTPYCDRLSSELRFSRICVRFTRAGFWCFPPCWLPMPAAAPLGGEPLVKRNLFPKASLSWPRPAKSLSSCLIRQSMSK